MGVTNFDQLDVTPDGVKIGTSGTNIREIRRYSQSLTPVSVGAAVAAEQTFTVTGLAVGDIVVVNPAPTGNATALCSARVSATNTLALTYVNPTAGGLVPGAGTYTILAYRP